MAKHRKTPNKTKWRTKSRRQHVSITAEIASYLEEHPGIKIGDLAKRCGLPYEDVYARLRALEKQRRIRIDARAQVFPRKIVVKPPPAAQRAEIDRRLREDRTKTRSRIEENRLAWIDAVEHSWLAIARPKSWQLDVEGFIRAVETRVMPAASDYLISTQIRDETKVQARQVLGVADTVRNALKGKEVDLRAFSPFKWPTTKLAKLREELVGEPPDASGDLFRYVGYRVGRNGLDYPERRNLLERLLTDSDIPEIGIWPPRSCIRLRRVAYAIAFLARQAKRRSADMSMAILDWETDLVWLKESFYVGRCDHAYRWPTID